VGRGRSARKSHAVNVAWRRDIPNSVPASMAALSAGYRHNRAAVNPLPLVFEH
jgi:hypothetical protein